MAGIVRACEETWSSREGVGADITRYLLFVGRVRNRNTACDVRAAFSPSPLQPRWVRRCCARLDPQVRLLGRLPRGSSRRLGGSLRRRSHILGRPLLKREKKGPNDVPSISLYIMTFQVSTGRSASLKLQSNFSAASGSSVGSW